MQFEIGGRATHGVRGAPDRRPCHRSRIGGMLVISLANGLAPVMGLCVIAGEIAPYDHHNQRRQKAIAELFQLIGVSVSLMELPL